MLWLDIKVLFVLLGAAGYLLFKISDKLNDPRVEF
jgi:hypothetical protein